MVDELRLKTLGGLSVSLNGQPLAALASRKAEALLVYLVCTEPFVANSRCFETVVGAPIAEATATLPVEVVHAAFKRGQTLDLWQTVEQLLQEFPEGAHT